MLILQTITWPYTSKDMPFVIALTYDMLCDDSHVLFQVPDIFKLYIEVGAINGAGDQRHCMSLTFTSVLRECFVSCFEPVDALVI